MEKAKVRHFKSRQKQLANAISKSHNGCTYSVSFEPKFKKNRVTVIMLFVGTHCNENVIGKILARQYTIEYLSNGFKVVSSFHPSTIANF